MPKIIEFYLCIQMLPAKCKWLHFSWATLYIISGELQWDLVQACCWFSWHIYTNKNTNIKPTLLSRVSTIT